MLRDSIASKDVAVRTFETQVTEDFVGTYSVPVLEVTVGNERVEFRPKGITVIGASGRVDIRGERDTVTLLRDEQEVKSGWAVVLQRVPSLRTAPLGRAGIARVQVAVADDLDGIDSCDLLFHELKD